MTPHRPKLRRFFGNAARLLATWLASSSMGGASINDCRALYSFTDSMNSQWAVQPPLEFSGFTPVYSTQTITGVSGSRCLNVPALPSSQSIKLVNWARDNGQTGTGQCNTWTLAMDIKPAFATSTWLSILQTDPTNADDAEIFIRADGSIYCTGAYPVPVGTFQANVWQRLVITCTGDAANGLTLRFYRNGTLVGTRSGQAYNGACSIGAKASLFTDNNGETNAFNLNALAFWTETLDAAAITSFGTPSAASPEFTWSGIPAASAMPGLTGTVSFNGFQMNLPSNARLGDGVISLGSGATITDAAGFLLTGTIQVKYVGGSLIYTGTGTLPLSQGQRHFISNVLVQASDVTVGPTGATGTLLVCLPVGMGVTPISSSRRLRNSFYLPSVSFITGLKPFQPVTVRADRFGAEYGDPLYLSLEEMPVRYTVTEITWAPSTGAFLCAGSTAAVFDRDLQKIRTREWNAYAGVVPDERLSNDDSFSFTSGRSGDLIVDTSTNGQAEIRTLNLNFTTTGASTGYKTHFPKGVQIHWSTGSSSQLVYANGIRQTNSYLYEGLSGAIDVPRDAPGNTCAGAGVKNYTFIPPDHWLFTRDHGLRAPVTLNSTNGPTVEWGAVTATTFAHKINTHQTSGWVMIPGCMLKTTEVATLDPSLRPAALLLSGIGTDADTELAERPGSSGYATGTADYGGINLRVAGGFAEATSRLAGTPVTYHLRNTAKYYLRRGGVSGIHEAVDGTPAPGQSYPINATLAGYNFGLTAIRLSFRDTVNIDSAISGNTNLPQPAGLQDLRFKTLRFGPRGELLAAVPESQGAFTLAYWRTQITPQAINFALPAGACPDPSEGRLVLGITASLPALSDQLFAGNLGIKPDGHTIVPFDNLVLPGGELVTSRLKPPTQLSIKGPGTTTYRLTPIKTGVYFNDNNPLPAEGFVALPGEMDVPFFRDLRVVLHASSASNATPGSTLKVWQGDNGNFDFFGATEPDGWNIGTPASGSLTPPLARKTWIDVINFELPAQWDDTLRRFKSPTPQGEVKDLMLFSTQQQVKSLGPKVAELTFGLESTGPNVNVSTLLDSLGADTNALLAHISAKLGGGGLTNAVTNLSAFEALLGDTLNDALAGPLDTAMTPVANQLFLSLPGAIQGNTVDAAIASASTSVDTEVRNLANGSGAWTATVVSRLNSLKSACQDLQAIAATPGKISALAAGILNTNTPPDASSAQILANDLNLALGETIAQITALTNQFQSGGGLQQQFYTSIGATDAWRKIATDSIKSSWVTNLDGPVASVYALENQAAFAAAFRKSVRDAFLGSTSAKAIRDLFGYSFSEVGTQTRGAFDNLMSAASQTIAASLPVGADIAAITRGNQINDVFGGVNLKGYANINGDSLKELRIDGKLKLDVPSAMTFQAWFIMRSVDSSVPGDGALAAAGITNEVAAGAATSLKWFDAGPPVNLAAEMRVGFDAGGSPITVEGAMGLTGELDIQGIKLTSAQLGVGMGGPNAYLFAKAAAKMQFGGTALAAEAAVFVGRTATLNPIQKVNTNVAALIGDFNLADGPIIGSYVYGYGQFSVLPLLGIPATPLLDIQVGGGSGFYLFYQSGSGDLKTGIQQVYGISGEVLCLVSVSGRLDSYIGINANLDNPSFANTTGSGAAVATLKGEIGIDPFSVSWSKNFKFSITFGSALSPKVQTHVDF